MAASGSSSNDHAYRPGGPDDSRSPCPALNTMANYGYLPRDGKNIGFLHILRAMQQVYNISLPLALFLAIPGYVLCGSILRMTVNLHDLAAHNKLEHDASLVHADAPDGSRMAPTNVDPALLHSFLTSCPAGRGFALEDYARIRIAREATLPPSKALDAVHAEISRGEAALSWLLMKDGNGEIPHARLEQWYGEERFPDGWKKPERVIGLVETRRTAVKVKDLIAAMKKADGSTANEKS